MVEGGGQDLFRQEAWEQREKEKARGRMRKDAVGTGLKGDIWRQGPEEQVGNC